MAGTNSGDETGATVGALIVASPDKTTPVDADSFAISDSAAGGILSQATWANIKATLKAYFDGFYTGTVPFYKSDGTASNISLTALSKIPFFTSAGAANDIPLTT